MHIRHLHLKDIRALRTVDLDLRGPDDTLTGLAVVTGGNGAGKSTVLRGLALALVGEEAGRELGSGAEWVRFGASEGSVVVDGVEGGERWTGRARLRAGGGVSVSWRGRGRREAGSVVVGFGAYRRLGERPAGGAGAWQVATLFDSAATLWRGQAWLGEVAALAAAGRRGAGRLLEGALDLVGSGLGGAAVDRVGEDGLWLRDRAGVAVPLRAASGGHRAAVGLALEVLAASAESGRGELVASRDSRTVATAEGVVLVDELDAHLHPEWQRRLGAWLAARFPAVQIVATTHSPLVAASAGEGRVFALGQAGGEERPAPRLDERDYWAIASGRADEVLRSPAFGLRSTRSESASAARWAYARLRAKGRAARLSAAERAELDRLARAGGLGRPARAGGEP